MIGSSLNKSSNIKMFLMILQNGQTLLRILVLKDRISVCKVFTVYKSLRNLASWNLQ